ncbi:MAG: hypothetical protein KGL39_54030 [Patescibacteria group bacterium]|nr:hypothetical protein [Patescibacteria group bacterium]
MKTKKYIASAAFAALTLVIVLCAGAWPYPTETVPQSQAALNSYFVTGATPSQTNYAELIDTVFYYVNVIASNAAVAQSAALAAASQAHCSANFIASNGYWQVVSSSACSFTWMPITNNSFFLLTFALPATNSWYVPMMTGASAGLVGAGSEPTRVYSLGAPSLSFSNRTVNGLWLQLPDLNHVGPTNVAVAIFTP